MIRHPHRARRRVAGFTLVELLVVVAIIAMLISMLLPSLKGARDAARGVACGANQRSCTTALFMFANDRKQWIPPAWLDQPYLASNGPSYAWGEYPTDQTWYWSNALALGGYLPGVDSNNDKDIDWLSDPEVIGCPMQAPFPTMRHTGGSPGYYSFAMRSHFPQYDQQYYRWWQYRRNEATPLGRLFAPASQPLLLDSVQVMSGVGNVGYQHASLSPGTIVPHLRHAASANVAYCDGSVRMTSLDDMLNIGLPTATGTGAGITYVVGPMSP